MQDQFNPYAAPATVAMHPRAAEWLRSPHDPSLQKVATGLGLLFWSIIINVGMFLVLIVAMIVLFSRLGPAVKGQRMGGVLLVQLYEQLGGLLFAIGVVTIVAYLMRLIGSFFCLATPEESGAKGLITASVVLTVIATVLQFAGFVISDEQALQSIGAVQGIASVLSGIIFLFYLKRLAVFIGSERLTRRAQKILSTIAVSVVGSVVAILLVLPGNAALALIAALILLVISISVLIAFVRYVVLLYTMQQAIRSGNSLD